MSVTQRWREGVILYAPAKVIRNAADIARYYGAKGKRMYILGRVTRCSTRKTAKGKKMKYVTAQWFIGGDKEKIRTVAIGNTKLVPPEGSYIPNSIPQLGDSILHRPTPPANAPVLTVPTAAAAGPVDEDDEVDNVSSSSEAVDELQWDGNTLDCVAHDCEWNEDDNAVKLPVNGLTQTRTWHAKDSLGSVYDDGCDPNGAKHSRLDYFLLMFPPKALTNIVDLTNHMLQANGHQATTTEEVIKFFGLIILATRFEFGHRASLWSAHSISRWHKSPEFGRSGMGRCRFDTLWQFMRYSYQPLYPPPTMSSEEHRWMLVPDFIRFFNEYRETQFVPSERICVDESMIRWYGMGGDWINTGLPMYVAMDRKPENGGEIQNACCADSGVMLRLRIVKTKTAETASGDLPHHLNHGTAIIKDLVFPWAGTGRIVAADSYFASVETALELYKIGL
jgi:hypothetical protein